MDTRVKLALQKEKKTVIDMQWLTQMDAWTYMQWNAQKGQLELMEDQKPLPHETLLESLVDAGLHQEVSLSDRTPARTPIGVDPLSAGAGVPSPGRPSVGAASSVDQRLR